MPNVPPRKNARLINKMFADVAPRYDLTNTVLSGGIHYIWRRRLVMWSGVKRGQRVLDCATGTGDLAVVFKKAVGPSGKVVATDFCEPMIQKGPLKASRHNVKIDFSVADTMNLPFKTASFDLSSIAFGIRNVADARKAIQEMTRVVKPNGKLMILEFGQPPNPFLKRLFNMYSQNVLPKIGGLLTSKRTAYEYLQDSSSEFPCGEDFVTYLKKTNLFSDVAYKPLSFGIAYMYKATVKK